jgi:hypothetical protein
MFRPRRAPEASRAARLPLDAHARVERVTGWLFVAAIATPLVVQVVRREHASVLATEYRVAARLPRVPASWHDVLRFPDLFQAYYDDSYGLREALIETDAFVKLRLFGVSPAKDVIVGTDGWLFLNADHSLEVSLGYGSVPREHVERWMSVLAERQRSFAERHIAYVFAFAPNKEEIYPEHVPARFARTGPSTLDDFVACAAKRGVTCFVDLRPALLSQKARDVDPVYHPGDTHWTANGAWAACSALLEHLHATVPALPAAPRASLAQVRVPCARGDLDREVGRPNALASTLCLVPPTPRAHEVSYHVEPKCERRYTVDDRSLPRVLFLHDSFGANVQPYLAEQCAELLCLADYSLAEDVVELEKPDVVIQLYTERVMSAEPMPRYSTVRRLTSGECGAIEKTIDVDSLDAARRWLVPRGGTTIAATANGETDGFAVEMKGAADTLATPSLSLAPGAHPIVRVDVTSPTATVLHVFYMTRADPNYLRTRTCPIGLAAGRNDVCFEMLAEGVVGPLLVRPGLDAGRYVVHRIAIGSSRR